MTKKLLSQLTYDIIGVAIEVHRELGPGLLESVYEKCMIHALKLKGIPISFQKKVPCTFKGLSVECELRYDILVDNMIVVEIKSVDAILPVHLAQLLTYIRLLGMPKGILLNFNCVNIFKEGQKTMVTGNYGSLPD